jgi:hypothetical protein
MTSLQDHKSVINQNPEKPREGCRGPEKEGVWCKIPHGGSRWGDGRKRWRRRGSPRNLTSPGIGQQLGEVDKWKKPMCN